MPIHLPLVVDTAAPCGARGDSHANGKPFSPFALRPMQTGDLPAVLTVQAEAYAEAAFAPEQPGVYVDRMAVAPDLCLVAVDEAGRMLGYLVSHPWHGGAPPCLDMRLASLPPVCECWYLHDCAVAAAAHGRGVAGALFNAALHQATVQGLREAALVAVGDAAGYWARQGYVVQRRPELAVKLAGYGPEACYMTRALVDKATPC